MENDKRPTRPVPDRTRPIRSWSTLLGPVAGDGTQSRGDGASKPRLEDAINRSVELGYRVVDDYIQQGQRAAQRMSEGKLTAEAMASEVQDLGGRIARYASDFFGAWVELLDLAAAGSAVRQGMPAPNGPAPVEPRPATRAAPPGAIRVEVQASRPVALKLDLRPERIGGRLRLHDLRSVDARKPRLGDVSVQCDGPAPVLRIGVPDTHPAGAYEGLLLDEATNRPVGSVQIVLAAPAAARRGSSKRRK